MVLGTQLRELVGLTDVDAEVEVVFTVSITQG